LKRAVIGFRLRFAPDDAVMDITPFESQEGEKQC